jgi:hypothetical protein
VENGKLSLIILFPLSIVKIMIIYEITAKVRLDLIDEFEQFMRETHIPDLLATGYFESAEIARVTDGVYRMRYLIKDRETLEQYFETDVTKLRDDFNQKFPLGVDVTRQILEVIQTWQV